MPSRSITSFGACCIALTTLLAACSSGSPAQTEEPSLAATPPAASAASAEPAATVAVATPSTHPAKPYAGALAVIPVGAGPRGVAAAGGSMWVACALGNVLQRVDPATNAIVDEVSLALPVTLVAIGDDLWVSVLHEVAPDSDDELVQVDGATGHPGRHVAVPIFHNIAAGDGMIWAVDATGELRRVDPATGTVTDAGAVGGKSIGIAASSGAVWGIRDDGMAWRLPAAGGDLRVAPTGVQVPGRSRIAVGPAGGAVWVAVPGSVLALDPDGLAREQELAIPGMTLVNDLWVTGTDVWLSANVTDAALGVNGGVVLRLDPATAEIVGVFPLGPESSGVVVAAGSLWAVDQHDNVLVRYALPE